MTADAVLTNPELYSVLFENDRVRVLEYHDVPGVRSAPHHHPDSVMVTLSSFDRRISAGDRFVDVHLPSGAARWLAEQDHSGHNTGTTETHCIFVELKEGRPPEPETRPDDASPLGPTTQ